ncbi:MAG: T9SS type A sorting domain-containing protein [Bacteroidota bacterium]
MPNPTARDADLTVSVDEPQTIDIAVFDMLGRRVLDLYSGTATGDLALTVDTRTLRSGAYLIRAMGEATASVRPFTVAR